MTGTSKICLGIGRPLVHVHTPELASVVIGFQYALNLHHRQPYDTIGRLGNPYVSTPNIDNLVDEGVAFTHAFCQDSACTPSREFYNRDVAKPGGCQW